MEHLERRIQSIVRGHPQGFRQINGAGERTRIIVQLDGAGWYGPDNIAVPEGIQPAFQPAYSSELQPAEHLWTFVDDPEVNTYFESIEALEKVISERRVALTEQHDMIRASTLFH